MAPSTRRISAGRSRGLDRLHVESVAHDVITRGGELVDRGGNSPIARCAMRLEPPTSPIMGVCLAKGLDAMLYPTRLDYRPNTKRSCFCSL